MKRSHLDAVTTLAVPRNVAIAAATVRDSSSIIERALAFTAANPHLTEEYRRAMRESSAKKRATLEARLRSTLGRIA